MFNLMKHSCNFLLNNKYTGGSLSTSPNAISDNITRVFVRQSKIAYFLELLYMYIYIYIYIIYYYICIYVYIFTFC